VSRAYRNSSNVPLDAIIKRLHELSDAVVGGRKTQAQEFVMRVPAECDHDADLVLAEAAVRLDALRKYNAELQAENDNLRKANQDCVAWEKACEANLDRALARVAELENLIRYAQVESGVCMCGDEIENHNQASGHSPVDIWDHAAEKALEGASDAWLLRKQAEAVESFLSQQAPLLDRYRPQPINEEDHCCEFNLLRDRERLRSEARRLRQQADELERQQ